VQAEGLVEYMIGDLRKKLQPVGRLDVLDGVGLKALAYYAAQDLGKPGRRLAGAAGARLAHDRRPRRAARPVRRGRARLPAGRGHHQPAAAAHPDDPQRIFDQSQSEYWVGYVQWYRGRLHEAEAAFRRYLDMAERMNAAKPGDHDWQLEGVFSKTNVGIVLSELGRADEALPLLAQARAEIAQIARSHPEDAVSEGNTIGWNAYAYIMLGTRRGGDPRRERQDRRGAARAERGQGPGRPVPGRQRAPRDRELPAQSGPPGRGHGESERAARWTNSGLNARDPANVDTIARSWHADHAGRTAGRPPATARTRASNCARRAPGWPR
jgi:tetratricopeptide (TPR) repeat protein